ncbi:ArsR family transcriptional regulator [Virgibacillus sp. DJP39]
MFKASQPSISQHFRKLRDVGFSKRGKGTMDFLLDK